MVSFIYSRCFCNPGYVTDPGNPQKCLDVDECLDTPCQHTCLNTDGSFYCKCDAGFVADAKDASTCVSAGEALCREKECSQGCEEGVCVCPEGMEVGSGGYYFTQSNT